MTNVFKGLLKKNAIGNGITVPLLHDIGTRDSLWFSLKLKKTKDKKYSNSKPLKELCYSMFMQSKHSQQDKMRLESYSWLIQLKLIQIKKDWKLYKTVRTYKIETFQTRSHGGLLVMTLPCREEGHKFKSWNLKFFKVNLHILLVKDLPIISIWNLLALR